MKFLVVVVLFLSGALITNAQTNTGSVVVNKDPRIDLLVNKQIEINEVTTRDSRRYAPGFRILVISSNDRNKVTDAKTTMYREFPELKAYMMYQSPFFRLKVGNFKGRADAEAYLPLVQKMFKTGVYVVPDTIEVRPELDN
jgi:hypothetical protein